MSAETCNQLCGACKLCTYTTAGREIYRLDPEMMDESMIDALIPVVILLWAMSFDEVRRTAGGLEHGFCPMRTCRIENPIEDFGTANFSLLDM
eukprot:SAG11_NODE_4150_length_2039_cov_20.321134_2_plen_92_part_01